MYIYDSTELSASAQPKPHARGKGEENRLISIYHRTIPAISPNRLKNKMFCIVHSAENPEVIYLSDRFKSLLATLQNSFSSNSPFSRPNSLSQEMVLRSHMHEREAVLRRAVRARRNTALSWDVLTTLESVIRNDEKELFNKVLKDNDLIDDISDEIIEKWLCLAVEKHSHQILVALLRYWSDDIFNSSYMSEVLFSSSLESSSILRELVRGGDNQVANNQLAWNLCRARDSEFTVSQKVFLELSHLIDVKAYDEFSDLIDYVNESEVSISSEFLEWLFRKIDQTSTDIDNGSDPRDFYLKMIREYSLEVVRANSNSLFERMIYSRYFSCLSSSNKDDIYMNCTAKPTLLRIFQNHPYFVEEMTINILYENFYHAITLEAYDSMLVMLSTEKFNQLYLNDYLDFYRWICSDEDADKDVSSQDQSRNNVIILLRKEVLKRDRKLCDKYLFKPTFLTGEAISGLELPLWPNDCEMLLPLSLAKSRHVHPIPLAQLEGHELLSGVADVFSRYSNNTLQPVVELALKKTPFHLKGRLFSIGVAKPEFLSSIDSSYFENISDQELNTSDQELERGFLFGLAFLPKSSRDLLKKIPLERISEECWMKAIELCFSPSQSEVISIEIYSNRKIPRYGPGNKNLFEWVMRTIPQGILGHENKRRVLLSLAHFGRLFLLDKYLVEYSDVVTEDVIEKIETIILRQQNAQMEKILDKFCWKHPEKGSKRKNMNALKKEILLASADSKIQIKRDELPPAQIKPLGMFFEKILYSLFEQCELKNMKKKGREVLQITSDLGIFFSSDEKQKLKNMSTHELLWKLLTSQIIMGFLPKTSLFPLFIKLISAGESECRIINLLRNQQELLNETFSEFDLERLFLEAADYRLTNLMENMYSCLPKFESLIKGEYDEILRNKSIKHSKKRTLFSYRFIEAVTGSKFNRVESLLDICSDQFSVFHGLLSRDVIQKGYHEVLRMKESHKNGSKKVTKLRLEELEKRFEKVIDAATTQAFRESFQS